MEINNVTFAYIKEKSQINNISAKVEKGKITTIIGPNGSGKSTFINIMSRNLNPLDGNILLDGKEIQTYSAREFARKLAVVHQQNEAPQDMTVEKLIAFGRVPHKRMFQSQRVEDEEAIDWAITCTNLQSKRKMTLNQLSGGERQRVWIAMSLAQKTPSLFLDEPTTHLDMYHQMEILELIKRLNKEHGMTIVMVLHDLNQAIRYSDHLIVLKDGQKMMEGEPAEIINSKSVRDIYGVKADVKNDEESGLYIVPIGI
ncbi:iron ABC transporter ATP-binding protein [Alkalihalobacillus alcalophilus ATCC 27647 = CGMCC 1.3604]|uniref:Iron ABC transporter ATP-binding protein n=1 Tax=Alkalihalobacillus alcalophilus ATCC 27647 = CGMCC 1.3604 TaxID=1218173 RepID=A0A4S4K4X6_ALKAL|nr:ABC transporter ATP-binding protein [Alkalihalobacillus alcalophilus]THG92087.1 iron ABC transporter ATP-binding protein [Alkalihalobacillus alcalophilus ATCC 27647 = CGMCC 1.3604]